MLFNKLLRYLIIMELINYVHLLSSEKYDIFEIVEAFIDFIPAM